MLPLVCNEGAERLQAMAPAREGTGRKKFGSAPPVEAAGGSG